MKLLTPYDRHVQVDEGPSGLRGGSRNSAEVCAAQGRPLHPVPAGTLFNSVTSVQPAVGRYEPLGVCSVADLKDLRGLSCGALAPAFQINSAGASRRGLGVQVPGSAFRFLRQAGGGSRCGLT